MTAIRLGIDNRPTASQAGVMAALSTRILQPIRDKFGMPVKVNSFFRCPELNVRIGGSKTSHHCVPNDEVAAADIEIPGVSNKTLAQYIAGSGLDFDQMILEFYDAKDGPSSGWVHVSYRVIGVNRGEVMTASRVNGRTLYEQGLL